MQQLLAKLQLQNGWKDGLKKTARINKVSIAIASYFSPLKLKHFLSSIVQKNKLHQQKRRKFWIQNELRALYWTLLVISKIHDTAIRQFKNAQWRIVEELFPDKSNGTLNYEGIRLTDQKKTINVSWTNSQNDLLSKIVGKKHQSSEKVNKWNELARQLFQKSHGQYFRTGKQCRQRWLNHLDLSKKHGQWTQYQDYIIAKIILSVGKKWSEIVRLLSCRTEHMVKNRYKSLTIKFRKNQGKSYNETECFRKIVKNYSGEGVQVESQIHLAVKTRRLLNQKQKKLKRCKEYVQLNKRSEKSTKQTQFKSFNKRAIQKIVTCRKKWTVFSMEMVSRSMRIKQRSKKYRDRATALSKIQSPTVWNHIARTPGYYGFSPCSTLPLFMSFGQCEKGFFQEYKNTTQN